MARDLRAFYAAQRRLDEAARAEWAALGGGLDPFRLTVDPVGWAGGLADDAFAWPAAGATRAAGQGVAALAAWPGRLRAHAAPALCGAAMGDGILVPPVPGVVTTAFAHRHPESEQEVALGYGFVPAGTSALVLHAGQAVGFEAFGTPPGTPAAEAAAHVLRTTVASLHGWRPSVRQDRLVQARDAARS